jgi:catechol 2,3-dioxygenase-like lactoylglutathione lyase family enzyme
MGATLNASLQGFHHVKLPVSDLRRSRDWYEQVLGLVTEFDFVEEGELMGVALRSRDGSVRLALRLDPARAAAVSGFDPIALGVPDQAELQAWLGRLADLAQPNDGIVTGHAGLVVTGLHDPDGIEVRLYTLEEHAAAGVA